MPGLSGSEAILFLHETVSSASDEDILDGWDRNLRAVVYRSWFHGAIDQLDEDRVAQRDLDLWQRALKSEPRMRMRRRESSSTSSSSSTTSSSKNSIPSKSRLRRAASASSASSSSSRPGRIMYNAPTKPSPVVIPSGEPSNADVPKIKKRRSEPRGLAGAAKKRTQGHTQKQKHIVPTGNHHHHLDHRRAPSPDRMKQFEQLNSRLGDLKTFIDKQFQSLRETDLFDNANNRTPRRRKVQVGNSSGGDSPPETSPSPSPSPSSRSRRRKLRKRTGGHSTPVAALDMIQETAHTTVEKEEDIVATVSPQWEHTPPSVAGRSYLLVSPKGVSKTGGRMHVVSPGSALPKSPIYDSHWEPKMSDTRVSVGLIPLREACVVTPSPDILLDDDDGDELDQILAKYL